MNHKRAIEKTLKTKLKKELVDEGRDKNGNYLYGIDTGTGKDYCANVYAVVTADQEVRIVKSVSAVEPKKVPISKELKKMLKDEPVRNKIRNWEKNYIGKKTIRFQNEKMLKEAEIRASLPVPKKALAKDAFRLKGDDNVYKWADRQRLEFIIQQVITDGCKEMIEVRDKHAGKQQWSKAVKIEICECALKFIKGEDYPMCKRDQRLLKANIKKLKKG